MKYTVSRREVHISFVEVEANSPKEAIEMVVNGGGTEKDYLEYSHTLDPDTWTVELGFHAGSYCVCCGELINEL